MPRTAVIVKSNTRQRALVGETVAAIRDDLRHLPAATTPTVRAVRRRYAQALARESPATVIAVADALFRGGSWPERQIASELVVDRPDAISRVNGTLVERWADGLAEWGLVDMYGVTVAGTAWREGRIPDRQVTRWARSADRWRRRLALVATVPLNSRARGGSGDATRTLDVCRMLVDDRDDTVVKALSWALRELVKRDPGSVTRFLQEEEGRLAARVRREVQAKLDTGRKTRLRS